MLFIVPDRRRLEQEGQFGAECEGDTRQTVPTVSGVTGEDGELGRASGSRDAGEGLEKAPGGQRTSADIPDGQLAAVDIAGDGQHE